MAKFKKIVTYIGWSLLIAIAVIVALRILLWVILVILPAETSEDLQENLGLRRKEKSESQEAHAAYRDHDAILAWIEQSVGSPEKGQMPRSVVSLLYPEPARLMTSAHEVATESLSLISRSQAPVKPTVSVHPAYIRVGQLSSSICDRRIAIDDRLSKAYMLDEVGALTMILLGLATTVLVALSSTELGKQENRTGLTIRTGALVCPAIGTAAAAMIAFYDPSGTFARQNQVAAGLQQLHAQMSNVVWSFKPIANPGESIPNDMAARLDGWAQRYQELIASVGDSRLTEAQRKSESPSPSPPQPQASPPQPQASPPKPAPTQ